MSGISTHVLDTALGRPAAGVPVILDRADGQHWITCASCTTDADGRCPDLLPLAHVHAGRFRLTFATAAYFAALHQPTLYPEISIAFNVAADQSNYHIPLLLNPFGYTTYRGT
jgi:5-hydroxyisourate hydrolase